MTEYPPVWVGAKYPRGGIFQRRVLLIGESTYPAPGDDTWLYNRRIPTEHMSGSCRDGFRTRLIRALLGSERETSAQIQAMWNSVAFFNYITAPLAGANEAPTEDHWRKHHQPLAEHLCDLKPDVLIVVSFRLWDRLIDSSILRGRSGPVLTGAGRPNTLLVSTGGDQVATAYGMKHPSYISWRAEHTHISRLLCIAPGQRVEFAAGPRLVRCSR